MASFTKNKNSSHIFVSHKDLGYKAENLKASTIPSVGSSISDFIPELLTVPVTYFLKR